ncbi:hypothetical protein [Frankia sp. AiPa1]|uniref:hypothetical protein n=1 Tax=Frankia sp. AiPa1 TaxID=573492 RepID=UPI00202B341C|nr:hypothetical protein [Frankia sp. AiPa1]MCL9759579.1 hypothetical protein [Frankia sp. AiPa1]
MAPDSRLTAGRQLWLRMRQEADPRRPPWAHPVPDAGLLSWLRRLLDDQRLHVPEAERRAAGWLGVDLFGLNRLPPAPDFLAGVDVARMPAAQVAPLLRRLSLTRPAPSADELSPRALGAAPGRVFRAHRAPELVRWGRSDADTPVLAETVEIPFVAHGIWVGQPMPTTTAFRDHYAEAVRRHPDLTAVLWTDIPRRRAAAVLAELAAELPAEQPDALLPAAREPGSQAARGDAPDPRALDPLTDVRPLVRWALDNDIALVNVHEVFHAGAPLYLHPQYVLEMAKQRPRGYTSATDHLRVELVHTFGGLYIDGDIRFGAGPASTAPGEAADPGGPGGPGTLPDLFGATAASAVAFTLNILPFGISNDLILGPARHPALRLWMECARLNYLRAQRDVAGGLDTMGLPYVGQSRQGLRHLAPHRTGRVHHLALGLLGLTRDDFVPTAGAVTSANETTWVPRGKEYADIRRTGDSFLPAMPTGGAGAPAGRDDVLERTMGLATFLIWQLVTREGNLYLSAVEPVVAALPDPDAVWIALLHLLASIEPVRVAVTSLTAERIGESGAAEHVWLPPEADALLDRAATPPAWFGRDPTEPDRPVWLLDEVVAPVALRRPPPAS